MTVQLRDYQLDVIARARRRIAEGRRRVLVVAPTGAGKTHVSSEIAKCSWQKGKRVLFIAHRRRLIEQKSQRLDLFGVPHGIIMDGYPAKRTLPVQVASRDTLLSRCVRNEWGELPPADLVIVDEAHNWMSDECQRLLARYGDAVVLGLTATPARSDGRGLGDYFDALETTVPTSQLVKAGCLVPVRCYAPDGAGQGKKLVGDPVAHWRRYGEGRPTVLFAGKVAASLAVVAAFNAAGVKAEHIDAHTPDGDRDGVADRVASGQTKVVANVGIWTEGVDIPELAVCQILRGCGSYVLFAQAVGRVMRAHPSKEYAILIDHAGAVQRHGFPDEDAEWSLETTEKVDDRVKADKEAGSRRQPVVCPKCACVFSGTNICPCCGHVLHKVGKRELNEDGVLVEMERRRSEAATVEERQRRWLMFLDRAEKFGLTVGAASKMYRDHFGDWPREGHGLKRLPRGEQWKWKVSDWREYIRSANVA